MNQETSRVGRKRGRHNSKPIGDQFPRVQGLMDHLRAAERRAESLREKRDFLRMMTTDTSCHLTGMPRSDSPDQQRIQTALAEIDELEGKITAAEASVQATRLYIFNMSSEITDSLIRKALRLYFFEHRSWENIRRELHCARTCIYTMRLEGLQALEEILKAEEEA